MAGLLLLPVPTVASALEISGDPQQGALLFGSVSPGFSISVRR